LRAAIHQSCWRLLALIAAWSGTDPIFLSIAFLSTAACCFRPVAGQNSASPFPSSTLYSPALTARLSKLIQAFSANFSAFPESLALTATTAASSFQLLPGEFINSDSFIFLHLIILIFI